MSLLAKHLQPFLLAAVGDAVGSRVQEGRITQGFKTPSIWYRRATVRHERALGEEGEDPFSETFDVEVWADDRAEADAIADLIRARDGYEGAFGEGTVQAVFVDEQVDDYVPITAAGDEGESVAALSLEVIPA
jgi:hypothetical protein